MLLFIIDSYNRPLFVEGSHGELYQIVNVLKEDASKDSNVSSFVDSHNSCSIVTEQYSGQLLNQTEIVIENQELDL